MPVFSYKAIADTGEMLEGEINATTRNDAIDRLQHSGYIPISTTEKSVNGKTILSRFKNPFNRKQIHKNDITLFTRELSTLLEAGLALDNALKTLEELSPTPPFKQMIHNINQRIKGGENLSSAMEAQGQEFDKLYLNTIRAGEAGGALYIVLDRLADYLERMTELRNDVISAMIYPVILFLVAILSIFFLLSFIVPQFVSLFEDVGKALPLLTQIIFSSAEFIQQYWWLMLTLTIGIVGYLGKCLKDPAIRLRWHDRCLDIPLYGELITKLDVARFARTLGTLLMNGVPLLAAISIVKAVVKNQVLVNIIDDATKALEQGLTLSLPLRKFDRFPKLAVQLIQVGEETGQLAEMLMKTADIYENESRTTIKRMLTLLEPVLILGLGAIIAVIIISILIAMLGLNELAF